MSAPRTILDAIDLATRAGAYHHAWLRTWERDAYYSDQLLYVALNLRARAALKLVAAIVGTDEQYGRPAREISPLEVRFRGELLSAQIECGLAMLDDLVTSVTDGAITELTDRIPSLRLIHGEGEGRALVGAQVESGVTWWEERG